MFTGLSNVCFVLQAQRADSLTVGIPNGRKTELLEPVLQPGVLWSTPRAPAFHSALPFQVSAPPGCCYAITVPYFHRHTHSATAYCMFLVSKVLEEHVPPVWPVYAPSSVHPQNHPDSEREQPQDREHFASTGDCELTHTNSLCRASVLKLGRLSVYPVVFLFFFMKSHFFRSQLCFLM